MQLIIYNILFYIFKLESKKNFFFSKFFLYLALQKNYYLLNLINHTLLKE